MSSLKHNYFEIPPISQFEIGNKCHRHSIAPSPTYKFHIIFTSAASPNHNFTRPPQGMNRKFLPEYTPQSQGSNVDFLLINPLLFLLLKAPRKTLGSTHIHHSTLTYTTPPFSFPLSLPTQHQSYITSPPPTPTRGTSKHKHTEEPWAHPLPRSSPPTPHKPP